MISGGSDMHRGGGGGFAALKVCKQCPLVLLVRADRWQGGGMRTTGARPVWAACCVWSAALWGEV